MDSTAGFILTGGRSSRLGGDQERSLAAACEREPACLVPETVSRLHLLFAVYQRRAGDTVECAIKHKRLTMHDLFKSLRAVLWPIADAFLLNVYTPLEWGTR